LTKPFIFEDHIKPISAQDWRVARHSWTEKIFKKKNLDAKIEEEIHLHQSKYDIYRDFFSGLNTEGYSKSQVETVVKGFKKVIITGEHEEEFALTKDPLFDHYNEHSLLHENCAHSKEFTTLTLNHRLGEFGLLLFGIPQVDMQKGQPVKLKYSFSTEFSLYPSWNSEWTKKLVKVSKGILDPERLFFKQEDKLVFRAGDGLDEHIKKGVTYQIHVLHPTIQNLHYYRTGFKMQGQLYVNGSFAYQGRLDSDGFFPFLNPYEPGDKTKESAPESKQKPPLRLLAAA